VQFRVAAAEVEGVEILGKRGLGKGRESDQLGALLGQRFEVVGIIEVERLIPGQAQAKRRRRILGVRRLVAAFVERSPEAGYASVHRTALFRSLPVVQESGDKSPHSKTWPGPGLACGSQSGYPEGGGPLQSP
jgi:hypothetical protein